METADWAAIAILGFVLLAVYFWLQRGHVEQLAPPIRQIVVDGTNVLFWRNETAMISTLKTVIDRLQQEGFYPVVFLDASSRHHVGDKSLSERRFAHALGLTQDRVMVVPAGTEADGFILEYAGEQNLAVVSNDRFRDRPTAARNIRLVKGHFQGKRLVLKGL